MLLSRGRKDIKLVTVFAGGDGIVCFAKDMSSLLPLLGSCYAVHIKTLYKESIHRKEEHAS